MHWYESRDVTHAPTTGNRHRIGRQSLKIQSAEASAEFPVIRPNPRSASSIERVDLNRRVECDDLDYWDHSYARTHFPQLVSSALVASLSLLNELISAELLQAVVLQVIPYGSDARIRVKSRRCGSLVLATSGRAKDEHEHVPTVRSASTPGDLADCPLGQCADVRLHWWRRMRQFRRSRINALALACALHGIAEIRDL